MKFNKQKVKTIVMEQFSDKPGFDSKRLEDLLEDLLAQLEKLDLSIDYLAGAVTGDSPLDISVDQATLGRIASPQKRNRQMQETKDQLKKMVQQVINEADPEDIQRAVASDDNMEELLTAMAERVAELENQIQTLNTKYAETIERFAQITGEQR